MKKLIVLLMLVVTLTGCSNVEIIREEIKLNDVGFYPAKVEVEIGKETHIKYIVTNYRNNDIVVQIGERKPDYLSEEYEEYKIEEHNIWLVIPERNFVVKSGESYELEIIIGKPEGIEIENDVEMWVSAKCGNANSGKMLMNSLIELNSKILIGRTVNEN